jgi:hypothetical protein
MRADIEFGNALRFKLTEIGERDRVEVILTNPPFGGEEEAGIGCRFHHSKFNVQRLLVSTEPMPPWRSYKRMRKGHAPSYGICFFPLFSG